MKTFQDLQAVGENEQERMAFVRQVINDHLSSKVYKEAKIATEYDKGTNVTIVNFQKLLYTISGKAVPDNWSANYKIPSRFFHRFTTQQAQYLLGNGVMWNSERTGEALGKDFDTKLQRAAKLSLVGGVSFGFFNLDHLEVFSVLEFAPMNDEENGSLRAGIRFWQIDQQKPLRATLYEEDGYTEYIWRYGEGQILQKKRAYKITYKATEADGTEIYDMTNYPAFPIVPLYANDYKQSELVGIREQIDAYDLIKSGFCDQIDENSLVYWTITNAGGMDDIDLATFVQRMKTVRAAAVSDGEQVQAHALDIPFEAREAVLDRLRRDLYRDYMALDTEEIASGAVTATQIKAAYEPMDSKADDFEYYVIEFISAILILAGIEDAPSFTRSKVINEGEEIQNLVSAAQFLPEDYVTQKVLEYLGDGDKAEDILRQMADDEVNRNKALLQEALENGEGEET